MAINIKLLFIYVNNYLSITSLGAIVLLDIKHEFYTFLNMTNIIEIFPTSLSHKIIFDIFVLHTYDKMKEFDQL